MRIIIVCAIVLWIVIVYGIHVYISSQSWLHRLDDTISLHWKQDTHFFRQGLSGVRIQHPVAHSIIHALQQSIVGMDDFLLAILISFVSGGHILVEWLPGLAKTKTIRTFAHILGLHFSRIQFTPDMLPSDIVGVDIYNQQKKHFETVHGPIFAHIVLADEINRASPKVQSALLEAMQEKQVTVGWKTVALPDPFVVLATQNPLEQEGTYPLPEAQIDRFFFKVLVDYPSAVHEKQMLGIVDVAIDSRPLSSKSLQQFLDAAGSVHVSDALQTYIVDLVQATRKSHPDIVYGCSPRGSITLLKAAQSLAYLCGRDKVILEDVQRVALLCLRHRIVVSYKAKVRGVSEDALLMDIFATVKH